MHFAAEAAAARSRTQASSSSSNSTQASSSSSINSSTFQQQQEESGRGSVRHLVANGTVSVSALAPSWYINGMNPSLQVVVGGSH